MAGKRTIKVPDYLYERIRELAIKNNLLMYQVIEQGLNYVELYTRKPYRKKELPKIDKVAWYCFKLAQSVGAFKENNSLENWRRLLNTVQQVRERLGVDTKELEGVLEKLNPEKVPRLTQADKIMLNDATKRVILQMINMATEGS